MAQSRDLTGDAHRRFVTVATLLSLIDPVRGEPTVHSLDRHPHDNSWKEEHLRKRFLDSFALICSTSEKGGETASAVCLEQGHPSGSILRLARNLGIPSEIMDQLRQLLGILTAIASGETSTKHEETRLLLRIIDLVKDKIRSLLARIHDHPTRANIERTIGTLESGQDSTTDLQPSRFRQWVRNLPVIMSLEPDTEPALLVPHIQWASQARWVYSEDIEELFCANDKDLPNWVYNIYKLGRYHAAAKTMLKLAAKQPFLFAAIHVEVVDCPERQRFSLSNDRTALMTVIQKLTKVDHEQLLRQLGQLWLTEDPESRFRKACRLELTVHAEMQLLSFYDHHPELTPRLLYMGTSKKACFLCHKFMSRHPLMMSVSASHQKLYPSWMPAPCSDSTVRKNHKVLLWELSRHLEQTTARDLENRLGIRRPKTLDSTAGPSLPTTESIASGWWIDKLSI